MAAHGGFFDTTKCYCGQQFASMEALKDHVRAIGTGEEPLQMIEQTNMTAYDALRLAVDLHSQRYRYQDVTSEAVLADAEEFFVWLKEKQEDR